LEETVADIDMKALALVGARQRLAHLDAERAAILRSFPMLRSAASAWEEPARGGQAARGPGPSAATKAAKGRKMTAAQKKAVGVRMKNYWAERKAKEAKKR